MVGPGTGVAPFRSVVQERVAADSADKDHLLLVFGNRNREADFHLSHEWKTLVDTGKLTLLTAFSRDQPHKMYVFFVVYLFVFYAQAVVCLPCRINTTLILMVVSVFL